MVPKCTAVSQSRNEALNYVENTMYFETSDLKIHFLMIRNSEITIMYYTIKYPYLQACLAINEGEILR